MKNLTTDGAPFCADAFLAMNAFREFSEIVSLLQPVAGAHPAIAHFLRRPNAKRLSELLASLLNMQGEEKCRALAILKSALDSQQGEPWQTIRLNLNFARKTAACSPAVTECGEIESWRSDVPVR
ncbi:type I phosphomannose isomerase helical insertion domain-containing protein [Shigella boydii]